MVKMHRLMRETRRGYQWIKARMDNLGIDFVPDQPTRMLEDDAAELIRIESREKPKHKYKARNTKKSRAKARALMVKLLKRESQEKKIELKMPHFPLRLPSPVEELENHVRRLQALMVVLGIPEIVIMRDKPTEIEMIQKRRIV